ncbi:MAG: tyrosine recombinase XerC, partial [Oscillospiraceae bacterium]|nr:tyrosine recombinase XerC [Oscillospiraceae bacterium]
MCSLDYRREAPELIRDFLSYHENIKGHSPRTVDEYYLDLRTFFRYINRSRGLCPDDVEFENISIKNVDVSLAGSIQLREVYDFLAFVSRERSSSKSGVYGLNASSRARKISALKSFYKYLTTKAHLLDINPVKDLDPPKQKKNLPRYLSLEESIMLLNSISGDNEERDYCIILLFLSCGLRISELTGLNIPDVHGDSIRVLGKGNKVRIVYLSDVCRKAIDDYLVIRNGKKSLDGNALFLSRLDRRLTSNGVHQMIKKRLLQAGLDPSLYSAHKLRHTSATLMLKNGVDVRVIQEVLGHEHLSTTEIYTHVENTEL